MKTIFSRLLLVAVAVTALNGCATSGALTVLSLSASGVSLIATGKSLSGHVLSVALDQDCAMLHVLEGRDICIEVSPEPDTVVAQNDLILPIGTLGAVKEDVADEWPSATRATLQSASQLASASIATTPGANQQTPLAAAKAEDAGPAFVGAVNRVEPIKSDKQSTRVTQMQDNLPLQFTVIGSFADQNNAQKAARDIATYDTHVLQADTDAGVRYRVLVYGQGGSRVPAATLADAGFAGAWPLTLCTATLRAPPCEQHELVAGAGG